MDATMKTEVGAMITHRILEFHEEQMRAYMTVARKAWAETAERIKRYPLGKR